MAIADNGVSLLLPGEPATSRDPEVAANWAFVYGQLEQSIRRVLSEPLPAPELHAAAQQLRRAAARLRHWQSCQRELSGTEALLGLAERVGFEPTRSLLNP